MAGIKASVFVLMPFKDAFLQEMYENGIEKACNNANAFCRRLDKELIHGRMTDEIYNQIDRADILIADVTGLNPNVFYEIGFAHGIGKNVILIKRSSDTHDFPFDTHDFQHIIYTDANHLKEELTRRVSRFSEKPEFNEWNSAFHKKRRQRYLPKLYDGFTEASISMEREIKPLLSKEQLVNIKLLGMALHKSFPLVAGLIEDNYLGKWKSPLLTLDLAAIRKEWIIEKGDLIHKDWMDRLDMFEEHLAKFKKKAEGQVELNLYRFHHMPYLHGMLVNEQHLFLGSCSWDRHNKLTVGGNPYEKYSGDIMVGDRKIEQFSRWFNYCVKEHKYYSENVK
ncbi:MAG: nucleoside 2-deoxyribosyltransferase [Candidatus Thiosymbion ectosymbiont of Robbea hypermnestra]|nr:nucleoside 2-deoxyribosyltransferase [Candidatus Thiosymbion ectosymbiont of Robbea hypermnestra]